MDQVNLLQPFDSFPYNYSFFSNFLYFWIGSMEVGKLQIKSILCFVNKIILAPDRTLYDYVFELSYRTRKYSEIKKLMLENYFSPCVRYYSFLSMIKQKKSFRANWIVEAERAYWVICFCWSLAAHDKFFFVFVYQWL